MDWSVLGDRAEGELRRLGERLVDFGFGLAQALLIVVVARLVVDVAQGRLRRSRMTRRLEPNLVSLLANLLAIVIYVVALALVLAVFGVALSALVTYLSVTTLAVGLALQETLRNTVAGIYLLLERPFRIGDRIGVRDVRGRVEGVEVRTTAIRDDGGDLVLVPNAIVFTEVVTNRTATRAARTRVRVAKLPGGAMDARLRVLGVVESLDGLRPPTPEVEAVAQGADGTTVDVSVWHDPSTPVRTRLVAALLDAFPDCEVTSDADTA